VNSSTSTGPKRSPDRRRNLDAAASSAFELASGSSRVSAPMGHWADSHQGDGKTWPGRRDRPSEASSRSRRPARGHQQAGCPPKNPCHHPGVLAQDSKRRRFEGPKAKGKHHREDGDTDQQSKTMGRIGVSEFKSRGSAAMDPEPKPQDSDGSMIQQRTTPKCRSRVSAMRCENRDGGSDRCRDKIHHASVPQACAVLRVCRRHRNDADQHESNRHQPHTQGQALGKLPSKRLA